MNSVGYWILVGMIVCVVALVIVTLTMWDETTEREPDVDLVARPEAPAPATVTPLQRTTPFKSVKWLAFVPSHSGHSWPERIAVHHSELHVSVRPVAEMTIETIARELTPDSNRESFGIVSFVVGLDDILTGMPLDAFQDRLGDVLNELDRDATVAIIGNVPDLSLLGIPGASGLAETDLRLISEDWNSAIDEVAHRNGAIVVDLVDLPRSSRVSERDSSFEYSWSLQDYDDELATRFAPAISAALARLDTDLPFVPSESPSGATLLT